ncbi:MAG: MaoC/PaaZ C-terminal domain-containing protein, partial [Myxococcota bacterium]|nr:MaoC/PaaZ C-terminal domain-containing protein [Myxococcota bacterium]
MSTWTDLQAGHHPEPWTFGPLTRTDFVRYQGASGDMNPVHHDEVFARNAGLPGPLAVGMFAAGAMNSYGTRWLGADNVRRTRMRWKAPAFEGYELTV